MNQFVNKLLFLFFLAVSIHFSSKATHSIGGDIQVQYLGGTSYSVTLNSYVNENSVIQYNLGVDPYAYLSLYDQYDNFQMNVTLPLVSNSPITSNSNACVNSSVVRTNYQVYRGTMNLAPPINPNLEYYLVWDLCCRNIDITNLNSPSSQNTLLYVQFPGPHNPNSSPVFSPLQNEYFCANQLNTINFSATDPDGDLLVYSLTDPLQDSPNGLDCYNPSGWPVTCINCNYNYSPPMCNGYYAVSKPFNGVTWLDNTYSGAYPIPCNPGQGLSINQNGIMTFNPTQTGLYTFAVLVKEYRNNLYIGEVIRDFQFDVQVCPINNPPVIGFKDMNIKSADTITVALNQSQCYPLYITDLDASKLGISETVYTTVSSGSYPSSGISIPAQVNLSAFYDTATANVCFNPCSNLTITKNGYYPMSIIVRDNRCPVKYDTLLYTLKVIVPQVAKPTIEIVPASDPKYVKVDSLIRFSVIGMDSSATNILSLTMYDGQSSMSFPNVSDSVLHISSVFNWTPTCKDMQQNNGNYQVYFVVKDNSCIPGHTATVYQNIIVEDNSSTLDSLKRYNLVTPNGDGRNDYWALTGIPPDNCEIYFKSVEVYDRWGGRVFLSHDKYFRWYPDVSDGVYYYSIDYHVKKYAGWVEVVGEKQ
jgi:hypothetical protein